MEEYIKREALIKKIKEKANPQGATHITPQDVYKTILTIIECESPSDVTEIRHGKWIGQRGKNRKYDDFNCSVCGYHSNTSNRDRLGYYCENCGTRMDLGDDEE